jgi:phosphatidylserine/phosphatidylglycerophosphate/cardiolipin synthase-like enzyme
MRTVKWILVGALLGVAVLPYVLFQQKDMPKGTSLLSPDFEFSQARLLIDRSKWDSQAQEVRLQHQIFDTILDEIESAETFLIADYFLWNPWRGAQTGEMRPLATELAEALLRKRIQNPNMPMLVITDPINRIYGDHAPDYFERLAGAGISVVYTDLGQLPDSNRVYAPQAWFWQQYLPAENKESDRRWVPNPFDSKGTSLSFAQLGRMLYFKANHRKVLITGRANSAPRVLVGSFNPADGSAKHSNVAALVDGAVAIYAAHSELDIAEWSSAQPEADADSLVLPVAQTIAGIREQLLLADSLPRARAGVARVAWRSEGAIQDELIAQLNQAGAGSRVDAAVFYFSNRRIIQAFKEAIQRGAEVRVLLDANRDAFGREKNGIPNRPVAAELMAFAGEGQIEVRWAATHGEQYHAKVLRIVGQEQDVLCLGSANWTRRNLDDLNLEANLLFQDTPDLGREFDAYFASLWTNGEGYEESLPYADWAEEGWALRWKTWLYRFQEWSGASTF